MAFLIADNRLTENSTWDERMLGEQLKILSELELDFGLEAIGFEVPEIDLFIDGLNTVPEADPDDLLPQISEFAITVPGDFGSWQAPRSLWQLIDHSRLRASHGWREGRSCDQRSALQRRHRRACHRARQRSSSRVRYLPESIELLRHQAPQDLTDEQLKMLIYASVNNRSKGVEWDIYPMRNSSTVAEEGSFC
jgi:hypothetical protein